MKKKYAVIDIGSNTIRLIIYLREANNHVTQLENCKTVSQLQNYLCANGMLSHEGIKQLIKTLKKFKKIMDTHKMDGISCIATAALRNAKNQQSILNVVKQKTGFDIRVLSGYEEAYYGFNAVVNANLNCTGLTIDVGGGSTEITYFKDKKLLHYHSFSFGALSLKQDYVSGDYLTDEAYKVMIGFIQEQLDSLAWLVGSKVPVIGIGGNAHNIVRVHQMKHDLSIKKLHGCEITLADLEDVFTYLQPIPFRKLSQVTGLSKKRADIILPALCVCQCLLEKTESNQFVLSRKGLREGLLYELLGQDGRSLV